MLNIFSGLLLAVVMTSHVEAGVYRWTDEDGKVHFGDRQPASVDATSVNLPDAPTQNKKNIDSFDSTHKVKTNNPIKPNTKTKLVKFDKIIVDLTDSDSGGTLHTIGRTFEGLSCSNFQAGRTVYLKRNHAEVNSRLYKSHFIKLLKDNGYSIIDSELQIFSGMKRQPEKLQIAAVIKEIKVNRCFRRRTEREAEVADYIKIEWKVFDPLNREIIYETVTEGSSRETYDRHTPKEVQLGGVGAFRSAISNLLAKSDFATVLSGKTTEKASPQSAVLPINLSYTNSKKSFSDQVDQLKAGTVTIRSAHGHGSGFAISNKGYVLTNAHVVGKADEVMIIAGEQQSRAHTVRRDFRRDVALLKLNEDISLPTQSLAKNGIGVGQTIYLIGTPLDERLGYTITRGIISAERKMDDGQRYYQTDAAVNSGNSGGPAINEHGEVVGIAVSGLFNSSGSSLNINFLIPIDDAINVLNIK
jgi:S1-C subfamily serine protease